ncbi:unnamed protein product [Hymenolepis diminuta]|uniref:Glycerol-3-phosphate dehydrogenase [NAD(+)] n=1 Tax=Hymenolepis diminuta TaxID=6216 RepID=A0A564Y5M0_HYMDI|nr:unnamed protein product [Hymenolepis diminuta]
MKQVCVLGCGALGTVLCNLAAEKLSSLPEYNPKVLWYVRSEKYGEYDLSEHLKTCRENNKYLPGVKIAEDVVISDDPAVVAAAADVILLAYATRHVTEILEAIKSHVKKDVLFVSFSKGLVVREANKSFLQPGIWLVSEEIRRITGLESMVISGALTARGLSNGEFCEVTLGAKSQKDADEIKQILQSDNLQLTWTDDVTTVEICGALKNILSVAAGLVDGLKLGANTKSAIIRLGLYEMGQYCRYMYGKYDTCEGTLLQSCGVSELFKCMLRQSDLMPVVGDDWDLYNLIIGRMLADPQYVKMTVEEIENSLQPDFVASGPDTAKKIYTQLSAVHLCERYPLFTAVHLICSRIIPANMLIPMLRQHPAHL